MEVVDDFPDGIKRTPFNYQKIADGKVYKLKLGEDITSNLFNFRQNLRNFCSRRGLDYMTRRDGEFLYVQVTTTGSLDTAN